MPIPNQLADLEAQLLRSKLLINDLRSLTNPTPNISMETLSKIQDVQKEIHILSTKVNMLALGQINVIIREKNGRQPNEQQVGQQEEQQVGQQEEQQNEQGGGENHEQDAQQVNQQNEQQNEQQDEEEHEEEDMLAVQQLEQLHIDPGDQQTADSQVEHLQQVAKEQEAEHPNELASTLSNKNCTVKLCHEIQEQIASMATIQDLHFQEFQEHILLKEQLRLLLLADLESTEHLHLQQMEQIQLEYNVKLEEKEKNIGLLKHEQACLQERWKNVACSICLEPWNSTQAHRLISLPCGHLFGDQCIRVCLMNSAECPQCRAPASANGLRYIYGCTP